MRSFLFISKSIKFCTPLPRAGNLFSSPGVFCLWYIPETHGCLPRSLQRKSICLPEETILHHHCCSCGFTVELLKTGSPSNSLAKKKWYCGWCLWQKDLRFVCLLCHQNQWSSTSPLPQGITTDSEVHCQFGSGCWKLKEDENTFLSQSLVKFRCFRDQWSRPLGKCPHTKNPPLLRNAMEPGWPGQ